MSGITIVIDDKNMRRKIKAYLEVFSMERLLKLIGLRQVGWITENFESQGAALGGWAQLSENTIAARRQGKGVGSDKILQDTGGLKDSFSPSNPDNIFEVDVGGALVKIGSQKKTAEFHQFGTGPYTIEPKIHGAYPLRFMTAHGMVATFHVNHPGLVARPMLPTEAIAKKLAVEVIDADLEKAKAKGQA